MCVPSPAVARVRVCLAHFSLVPVGHKFPHRSQHEQRAKRQKTMGKGKIVIIINVPICMFANYVENVWFFFRVCARVLFAFSDSYSAKDCAVFTSFNTLSQWFMTEQILITINIKLFNPNNIFVVFSASNLINWSFPIPVSIIIHKCDFICIEFLNASWIYIDFHLNGRLLWS